VSRRAVVLVACDPAPCCPQTPTRTAIRADFVGEYTIVEMILGRNLWWDRAAFVGLFRRKRGSS
jgi:hypothetical protein